jgi:elongation factor G
VDANIGRPQVAYRETIRRAGQKVEGKFVRQTGGRGQYGHVVINMSPASPAAGFIFEDKIVGGVIPREYINPVENGIKEALDQRHPGRLSGHRPEGGADRRVLPRRRLQRDGVQDRRLHGLQGGRCAGKPVLLEPIMDVEVVTPADYMGDIIGDLSSRRGRVGGMTERAGAG